MSKFCASLKSITIKNTAATFLKNKLSQLNQSILAKAFRGELVPQDPNDEPASVLLERIKAEREAEEARKKEDKAKARKAKKPTKKKAAPKKAKTAKKSTKRSTAKTTSKEPDADEHGQYNLNFKK